MIDNPNPRLQSVSITGERFFEELVSIRDFLQPVWADWASAQAQRSDDNGEKLAAVTSLFLSKVMGAGWRCTGGTPLAWDYRTGEQMLVRDGGFLTRVGWKPHWWVQSDAWIADLNAARFDAAPVILTRASDACYRATFGDGDVAVEKRASRDVVLRWQRYWMSSEAQRIMALRMR